MGDGTGMGMKLACSFSVMDLPQRSILGHPRVERRNPRHFFPRTVCNVSAVCVWGGWGGEGGQGVFTNSHKK